MAVSSKALPKSFPYRMYPLGETAVVVEFGETIVRDIFDRVQAFSRRLGQVPFKGMVEQVPAFTTVTVYFDLRVVMVKSGLSPYQHVSQTLEQVLHETAEEVTALPTVVKEIPVCYGGVYGPDLEFVAQANNLSPQGVIDLHCAGEYLVYMIGFAPGFPYLGGMDERLATPRKASPRAIIPAGSVGIAGAQTGIYPLETPGGWQLIGRTPQALFRPTHASPSLLKAGEEVRFYPISEEEYKIFREDEHGA
jgi:inhibitor of KinA